MVNLAEPFKLNMATAAIALGLMPTLFTFAGTNTVEAGILALQRPVLAFLLSAASPAVSPTRTFNYRSPFEVLEYSEGIGIKEAPITLGRATISISTLQYLVALGAVANTAHNTWLLCNGVVFISSPETDIGPILYVMLAALMHIAGFWALRLKVKMIAELKPISKETYWHQFLASVQHEVTPCASLPPSRLEYRVESYLFLGVSWLTSVGTVIYLFWSTYTFSSALFITVYDAQITIGRYLISILLCRVVVMYELSGMRHTVSLHDD